MSIQLSDRSSHVKPSVTLALNTKATELKAQGVDMVNLTSGEPDFDTPEPIKQACVQAIKSGYTKYSAVTGLPALREAICKKLQHDNHLDYQPGQIVVSNGAKQSLYNAMQAILNPGDQVIIPAPYWVSYPAMAALAGGEPSFIQTTHNNHFKLTAEQLSAAITPKTRILLLNSPSNPTGMVYSEEELGAIADVLLQHPAITLVSDDIYEYLCWTEQPFKHILNVCPSLYDRTIIVNGCSKAYAMTGWRIGYTAAPQAVTNAMKKIQSHSTSGPNTMAQHAAVAAIETPASDLTEMFDAYRSRLSLAHQLLNDIPGVACLKPQGAFYA